MGNKELHAEANGVEKASYSIIKYPACRLPDSYRNIIFTKYLHTAKHSCDFFKLIKPDSAWFDVHGKYLDLLLKKPEAKIRLCILSDTPDVVLGWSLMEPGILHYVWTGFEYRATKKCSALLPEPFHTFTHITKFWLPIWNAKYPKANFNPYQGMK